jgi:hypothetical protein
MVLTRRSAEEHDDPIAQKVVDRPGVLVHGLQHDVESAPHDLADLLGIEPFGEGGKAGDVSEEHSHPFVLTARAKLTAACPAVVPAGQAAPRHTEQASSRPSPDGCKLAVEASSDSRVLDAFLAESYGRRMASARIAPSRRKGVHSGRR